MALSTLQDLYVESLQDIYSAEQQIIKALPKMAQAAHSPELKSGMELHLKQTQEQAQRLEQIFQKLGADPNGKQCKAAQGLIAEADELLQEDADPEVLDAALIAAAQKVEHYEIATYGTICTWAKQLGDTESLQLLKQSLSEEKMTDEKLSQLAEGSINQEAANA